MRVVPVTGTDVPLHGRTGLDQAHARKSYLRTELVNALPVPIDDTDYQRGNSDGQQQSES